MKVAVRSLIGLTVGVAVAFCSGTAEAQSRRPVADQPRWVSPEPLPPDAPMVVCFAEGTDPAYVEAINAMVALQNQAFFGADYQLTSRWSGTAGTPRALTWSFVPDGLSIPGNASVGDPTGPSNLFSQMDAAFAAQGGRATWILRFQQVFDRWHALSGITYTRIQSAGVDWDDGAAWGSAGSATRGDVRISMHNIDGLSGILAYNMFPSNGDMVLDAGDAVAGNNFGSSGNLNRFLRNVVAHEHGHGIGLLHVCPANATKLMEPFISTAYDGPRQDDTRGAQRHYGDPFESNGTAATATNLGSLTTVTPITLGNVPAPISGTTDVNSALLAISLTGDIDFYKFTITGALNATATATPFGSTYVTAPQSAQCIDTSPTENTLTNGNLAVEILDTNGTTVLGTSNTTAAGVAETLSNVPLAAAGTYYVRITAPAGLTAVQAYKLTLSGNNGCVAPSFSVHPITQQVCDQGGLTLTVAASGSPAPTFRWRRNTVDLNDDAHISGAFTNTLSIFPVEAADAGSYDCVANNACGNPTSNAASIDVIGPIVISTQPQSQSIPQGQPVTFSVVATNVGSYQWRRGLVPIAGQTLPAYTIAAVTPADAGSYNCLLSSNCEFFATNSAILTVTSACYANCDGSTVAPILNVADFSCFLNRFAAGDASANCDGSTTPPVLNVSDFSCFLNAFAAGCT